MLQSTDPTANLNAPLANTCALNVSGSGPFVVNRTTIVCSLWSVGQNPGWRGVLRTAVCLTSFGQGNDNARHHWRVSSSQRQDPSPCSFIVPASETTTTTKCCLCNNAVWKTFIVIQLDCMCENGLRYVTGNLLHKIIARLPHLSWYCLAHSLWCDGLRNYQSIYGHAHCHCDIIHHGHTRCGSDDVILSVRSLAPPVGQTLPRHVADTNRTSSSWPWTRSVTSMGYLAVSFQSITSTPSQAARSLPRRTPTRPWTSRGSESKRWTKSGTQMNRDFRCLVIGITGSMQFAVHYLISVEQISISQFSARPFPLLDVAFKLVWNRQECAETGQTQWLAARST